MLAHSELENRDVTFTPSVGVERSGPYVVAYGLPSFQYSEQCSTFNAFDHPAVKEFKSRAQMRHEQFNGMLKEFSTLVDAFRHEQEKFKVCFEAAAVICQYRMEHGEPLYDILAGISIDE